MWSYLLSCTQQTHTLTRAHAWVHTKARVLSLPMVPVGPTPWGPRGRRPSRGSVKVCCGAARWAWNGSGCRGSQVCIVRRRYVSRWMAPVSIHRSVCDSPLGPARGHHLQKSTVESQILGSFFFFFLLNKKLDQGIPDLHPVMNEQGKDKKETCFPALWSTKDESKSFCWVWSEKVERCKIH